MRILILGGTRFAGRAMAAAALERGHQITLFNRGSTPGVFPEVEELHGDRALGLDVLAGRTWDAVIDPSGYVPRVVGLAVDRLQGAVGQYVFISTLSVYADPSIAGQDEQGALAQMPDASLETVDETTYGPLKVLCERRVHNSFGAQALIVRPGLIVGPHDPTDRFTYWPVRVARGGEVLAPGTPERVIQYIDVRDLGEWVIRMVEQGSGGVYNAVGPAGPATMGALLETCRAVSRSDARFTWVPEDFLIQQQVGPWMEMPLWIPASAPEMAGFFLFDSTRAVRHGLTFRALETTVSDTLAWANLRPADQQPRAGMSAERESGLLALYHDTLQP
ncbi:MAG TPA: NAD-dependent epimerase/dehydratase family protein [Anaerolineaceae bacterium]